mgnify:CR=1 FL=1
MAHKMWITFVIQMQMEFGLMYVATLFGIVGLFRWRYRQLVELLNQCRRVSEVCDILDSYNIGCKCFSWAGVSHESLAPSASFWPTCFWYWYFGISFVFMALELDFGPKNVKYMWNTYENGFRTYGFPEFVLGFSFFSFQWLYLQFRNSLCLQ